MTTESALRASLAEVCDAADAVDTFYVWSKDRPILERFTASVRAARALLAQPQPDPERSPDDHCWALLDDIRPGRKRRCNLKRKHHSEKWDGHSFVTKPDPCQPQPSPTPPAVAPAPNSAQNPPAPLTADSLATAMHKAEVDCWPDVDGCQTATAHMGAAERILAALAAEAGR